MEQTCVLRVEIKCCTGCQMNAKRKLQKIPGVSSIIYDKEEGLITVSGDVNPMALVDKIAKRGKKAELVSVQNDQLPENTKDISESSSATPSPVQSPALYNNSKANAMSEKNPDQNKKKRKCFPLGLFRKKSGGSKVKALPSKSFLESSKWKFPARTEDAKAFPFSYAPPSMYPPTMQGGMPRCPPYSGIMPPLQPPPLPPYGGEYPQMGLPQVLPPYGAGFSQPRQKLNPALHYTS